MIVRHETKAEPSGLGMSVGFPGWQSSCMVSRDTLETVKGLEEIFQSLRLLHKRKTVGSSGRGVAWLPLCVVRHASKANMVASQELVCVKEQFLQEALC